MNYRMVFNVLGKTLIIIAGLMLLPLIVCIYYGENVVLSFIIPISGLILLGGGLGFVKVNDKSLNAKEGFVIVALCWIILSLVGCLPFIISGSIPNFYNALFETVSGFTTTGASVLTLSTTSIILPKSIMFWRSFTHWIGGMGVLVFMLAVIPADDGAMHIFRAEAPGPSASKLVSRMRHTARILYTIYIVLTVLQFVMLMLGGMETYESALTAFSTAGTGGFSVYADSMAHYDSAYIQIVTASFMFIFGINFNLFYLILIGQFSKAIRSEEFITYLLIVILSTFTIATNLSISFEQSFGQSLRHAFFQTTAISSTTGFASQDFINWPTLSKTILTILTVVGACGGSTGGGMKVSRAIILFKVSSNGLKKNLHPRSVHTLKLDGELISQEVERNTYVYFILWVLIVIASTLLLSFDPVCGSDVMTPFSASITCISNVGPGMTQLIGPFGSFAQFTPFSKTVLSIVMLAGRLEIFPMIILFAPRTWRKGQ
jgi:trk system potassium uptake protein TrkH